MSQSNATIAVPVIPASFARFENSMLFEIIERILFSDIYDLNYFNDKMKKYNNGNNIMIPRSQKIFKILSNKKIIRINNINLWKYAVDVVEDQRINKKMSKDCMNIAVLKALKLKNQGT